MTETRHELLDLIHRSVAGHPAALFRQPLAAFASAADPFFEEIRRIVGPHHLRPRDILPEVSTVLSFFIPFSREVVDGNRGAGPVSRQWGQAYIEANALINRISRDLAAAAQGRGRQAAMVPATHTFDTKTLQAGWSHRSAAWVAGLGRFGLNRMLIGPAGCAGRYGTVFLAEKIEPDRRPEEETCLHLAKGRCGACVKACPMGALSPDGAFDRHKCYAHLLSVSEALNLGQLVDVCGKCVAACPQALSPSKQLSS